jgi:hypothetical protein
MDRLLAEILMEMPERMRGELAAWDINCSTRGSVSGAVVVRMVKEARGFLKHADRDPDAVLTFNTDWTDFLLFDAIRMHLSVAAEIDLINHRFFAQENHRHHTSRTS